MIIQATQKLQDFLGIKVVNLSDESGHMEAWHGNLFNIGRKKCLLLTHNTSLYSLFLYGITKKDIPYLPKRLKATLGELLRSDRFTLSQIVRMTESFNEIHYAKTSDRKVMGSMNDMMQMLNYYDMSEDEFSLASRINRTPYKVGGYIYPKEALRGLLS